jgi:formylglycine-generating enzyme required for sulfatase activity
MSNHIFFTDSFGCNYVLVEPQTFTMGDASGKDMRAGPSHEVEIIEPFFVAEMPCTQGLWNGVMSHNPAKHQSNLDSFFQPVESVSFHEVKEMIDLRNQRKDDSTFLGLKGVWRLPSEAEWECFTRAGTTSHWSFGDDEHELSSYGWYGANSGAKMHKVKSKKANPWNLFDVHGLVSEWCEDHWDDSYKTKRTQRPLQSHSNQRVIRGGSWFTDGTSTTSYHRSYADEAKKSDGIGFRFVWEPTEAMQ